MILSTVRLVALMILTTFAMSFADEKADVVALVKKAAEFHKKNGTEKTIAILSQAESDYVKGSLYVFAYDTTGMMVAHPKNAKLIGKNLIDVPDVDGKLFRKDIIELAKSKKPGWVDYKYKNPTTSKVEEKTTYVVLAGDMVLCCGAYK
jgi:signal transduction histidine kinase